MKKIFGILSLIAIMTVSFTSQASTVDNDHVNVVYDIGVDNIDLPTFDIVSVDLPTFDFGSPLATLTSGTTDIALTVPIVATNVKSSWNLNTMIGAEVLTASYELREPAPNLNKFLSEYNDKFGDESPDIVKEISTNIGKLTKFSLS
jgi:hypothetical protein